MSREVLRQHPSQIPAIILDGELMDRLARMFAEGDHGNPITLLKVVTWTNVKRPIRLTDVGDLIPVLALQSERLEHTDQHSPGGGNVRCRTVRLVELATDEALVGFLQVSWLTLSPELERIDDDLLREIDGRLAETTELGLERVELRASVPFRWSIQVVN